MKTVAEVHRDDGFAAVSEVNGVKPVTDYRATAKVFHWLTAALVLIMVCSGVTAKQLDGGGIADPLLLLHKTTGILTLVVVLMRAVYRLTGLGFAGAQSDRRPVIHWMLYAIVILVPLLGWAGVSDFGARDILFGLSLPAIWPEGAGYSDLLLRMHAYVAFALLAFVALHIGIAMQDYMTRSRTEPSGRDDRVL